MKIIWMPAIPVVWDRKKNLATFNNGYNGNNGVPHVSPEPEDSELKHGCICILSSDFQILTVEVRFFHTNDTFCSLRENSSVPPL